MKLFQCKFQSLWASKTTKHYLVTIDTEAKEKLLHKKAKLKLKTICSWIVVWDFLVFSHNPEQFFFCHYRSKSLLIYQEQKAGSLPTTGKEGVFSFLIINRQSNQHYVGEILQLYSHVKSLIDNDEKWLFLNLNQEVLAKKMNLGNFIKRRYITCYTSKHLVFPVGAQIHNNPPLVFY